MNPEDTKIHGKLTEICDNLSAIRRLLEAGSDRPRFMEFGVCPPEGKADKIRGGEVARFINVDVRLVERIDPVHDDGTFQVYVEGATLDMPMAPNTTGMTREEKLAAGKEHAKVLAEWEAANVMRVPATRITLKGGDTFNVYGWASEVREEIEEALHN